MYSSNNKIEYKSSIVDADKRLNNKEIHEPCGRASLDDMYVIGYFLSFLSFDNINL